MSARKRAGLIDSFPASDPLLVELSLDEGPNRATGLESDVASDDHCFSSL